MKVFVAALIGSAFSAEVQQLDAVISGAEAEPSAAKVGERDPSGLLEKEPRLFNLKESVFEALFGDSDSAQSPPATAPRPRPHKPLLRPNRPVHDLITRPSRLTMPGGPVGPEIGVTPIPVDPGFGVTPAPPTDEQPVPPIFPLWPIVPTQPVIVPLPMPTVDPISPLWPVPKPPVYPILPPWPLPKPPVVPISPVLPLPVLPGLPGPKDDYSVVHVGNNIFNINLNGRQNVGSGKVADNERGYRPPSFPVMPFYPARPEFDSHSDGGHVHGGHHQRPVQHRTTTTVVGWGAPK